MEHNAPRWLIHSTRLYQALLALYPSEFRRGYSAPMLQVFRDGSLRAHRQNGISGLVAWWGRTLLDTVKTALEEHTQRGIDMSRSTFIKLCGWLLMIGSLAFMLSWLANTLPEYHPNNSEGLAIRQVANAAPILLWVSGTILLSLGYIGLFLRYGPAAGIFGRLSLGVGALGGLVSAAGAIVMATGGPENGVWFGGMIVQYLGLMFFGVANLRQRVLPRWNGLPVLAGIWIPLFALLTMFDLPMFDPGEDLDEVVSLVVLLLSLGGMVGLGYLLQADADPAEVPALAV